MGFPSGGIRSVEETASLKMVLGSKEEVVNPIIGRYGGASSRVQHSEAMELEQTTLLNETQRRNRHSQQKKTMEQLKKSAEPTTKKKEGGTKRLRSEVSTPSPNTAGFPKKQRTLERQESNQRHCTQGYMRK